MSATMKRRREGRLRLCHHSGRYVLDGWELHCGDCLEVFIDGKWQATRIEHGEDWLLVGTQNGNIHVLDGLEARGHD